MKYIFINAKDHPRGNYILKQLLFNNFIPELIIEEDSTLSTQGLNFAKKYLPYFNRFSTCKVLIGDYNIPYTVCNNINDEKLLQKIKQYQIDFIILGDTRVIRNSMFDIPTTGIINIHPGYLPFVRGNMPYVWSILYDLPFGCTSHLIDENIDTGSIIYRDKIPILRNDSFASLYRKIVLSCGSLILKTAFQFKTNGFLKLFDQKNYGQPTFAKARTDDIEKVSKKLKKGNYIGNEMLEELIAS